MNGKLKVLIVVNTQNLPLKKTQLKTTILLGNILQLYLIQYERRK